MLKPQTASALPPEVAESGLGMVALDDLEAAPLRHGLALWRLARGDRPFPSRQQLVPQKLGSLLSNVVLVKVIEAGEEFEIRIVGDVVASMQEVNVQGLRMREVDELLPGFGSALRQLFGYVCKDGAAMAFRGRVLRNPGTKAVHREIVILPLGETDAAVDHLLLLIVYSPPDF